MIRSHQRITILLASFLIGPACKTRDPLYCEGAPLDNCSLIDAGCKTFSTQLDTCALGTGMDLTISGNRIYNTDTYVLEDVGGGNAVPVMHAMVTNHGDMMDVIVANSFTLTAGSTLRVVGAVPFGIVATGAIKIDGTINAVGGDPNGTPMIEAAGARKATDYSTLGGTDGVTRSTGASGGGGAGFRGQGGDGGQGDANPPKGMMPVPGGSGGMVEAAPPKFPRGGCHGGAGGDGFTMGTGGKAGRGGGAVDLISAVSIIIGGGVNAGGSGGLGGIATNGGGGGGGSGGMIVLEAPMIDGKGGVAANGGGGGGGGGRVDQADPKSGSSGSSGAVSVLPASGGAGGNTGSKGGAGGAAESVDGVTVTDIMNTGGGGGGGGAAGYIRVLGAVPTLAVVSPSPSPP